MNAPTEPARDATDHELVQALRAHDERAFAALVDRYHASLVRLAMVYVGDRAAAEDAAQEAWLGLLSGIDRFGERASLRTWLFSILINCARAGRRRNARATPFSELEDHDSGPAVDPERFHGAGHRWEGHWSVPPRDWPEERLLSAEIEDRLAEAVAHLPPRQRAVLLLRDIEGWPPDEICRLFRITGANERVLLHRARAHVRRELETYLSQP